MQIFIFLQLLKSLYIAWACCRNESGANKGILLTQNILCGYSSTRRGGSSVYRTINVMSKNIETTHSFKEFLHVYSR